MAEGKTSMFGKTYNTIGSTDSNFIIKTKGDLKIQWGNKFIDVIKNGNQFIYTRKEVEQRQFDGSRMYLYPIPQDDVFSLGVKQNPGW